MVLYRKVFLLGKDVSFWDYINTLRKWCFRDFVLTIDRIPATADYQAELFFTAPLWRWGLANAFLDGVFLKKCTIRHFESEKCISLQVSAKTENLFFVSSQILFVIVFLIFMITTGNGTSFNFIVGLTIITTILLVPSSLIYLRDKKFWDEVASLGTETEKK